MESELVVVSSGARDPHEDRGCWLGSSPLHPRALTRLASSWSLLACYSPPLSISQPARGHFSHSYLPGSPVSRFLAPDPCCFPCRVVAVRHVWPSKSFTEQGCPAVSPTPAFYILITVSRSLEPPQAHLHFP